MNQKIVGRVHPVTQPKASCSRNNFFVYYVVRFIVKNQTQWNLFCVVETVFSHGIGKQKEEKKSEEIRRNPKKSEEIRRNPIFIIILKALTACTSLQVQKTETTGTDIMPNPASVYCEQNGNKLEIHTAADGDQYAYCVFPDGSTCEELAFFHGECGPEPQNIPTPPIEAEPTSEASSEASNDDISLNDGSGGYMPPGTTEEIANWWGIIKSTSPGAQYDDYFERQDLGGAIYFGIDSLEPAVKTQIEALRDSGRVVHLYGALLSNVPDYNGSQILLDSIEVDE